MLFLFLYSIFTTMAHSDCSSDGARVYRSYIFGDGDADGGIGGHPITDGSHSTHVSIRFISQTDPGDVFWLQLINKASSTPLPVLVKSGRTAVPPPHSRDNTTSADVASCLYGAASALTRVLPDRSSQQDPGHSPLHLETTKRPTKTSQAGPPQPARLYQPTSFFTISLCHGIRGIVQLDNSSSFVLIHGDHKSDLVTLQFLPSRIPMEIPDSSHSLEQNLVSLANDAASRHRLKRIKRSSFEMPVGQMPGPFLVELYIIVDYKMARLYRHDNYRSLLSRITAVMNQVNMAFSQFNIYFTVVQLEIWEYDQIKLTDENHIIMELQLYKRRFVTKRHDCLHAILGENLGSSRRGQAEQASMCGYNSCVGYTKDYSGQDELKISHSVLHELGHNFGLNHDNEQCQCYGCIMATGVEFVSSTLEWSNCSRRQIDSLLKSGMADCLRDRPVSAELGGLHPVIKELNNEVPGIDMRFNPMCGNGVVDDGEQCDCGGSSRCRVESNRCCNPVTCRLNSNASCAGGSCCDMLTCSLKRRGVVCRPPGSESCDLPEYCDGSSEWCPQDAYKHDGTVCRPAVSREYSLCYRGSCHSRYSRCQQLWGDTGVEASENCFRMNEDGGPVKNCGLEIPHQTERDRQPRNWYNKRCSSTNARCGRLWCSHENERVLRPSAHVLVDEMLGSQHCSAVKFDMDWFFDDPGMVPYGAECGSGKVCWHSQCVPVSSINTGSSCDCHGHGVCNNNGHCHCDAGFAPPNCTTSGDGGSIDSGPPAPFLVNVRTVIAGVIICLIVILTGLLIAAFIYHYRNHDWPFFLSTIKCLNYNEVKLLPRLRVGHLRISRLWAREQGATLSSDHKVHDATGEADHALLQAENGWVEKHQSLSFVDDESVTRKGQFEGNGVRTMQYHSPGVRSVNRLVLVVDPNRDSDKTAQGLLQSPSSPSSSSVVVLSGTEQHARSPSDRPAIVHPKPKPEPFNIGTVTKLGNLTAGPVKKQEGLKVSKGEGETRPVILCEKPRKQSSQPTGPPGTLKKPVPKVVQKPTLPPRDVAAATSQTNRQLAKDAVSKVLVSASSKQPAMKDGPQTRTAGVGGPSGPGSVGVGNRTKQTPPTVSSTRPGPEKPVTKALISRPHLDKSSKEQPATKISPRPSGPSAVTKVTAPDKLPPILCSKPAQKAPSAVSSVVDATNRREPQSVLNNTREPPRVPSGSREPQPVVTGLKETQSKVSDPKKPQPMANGSKEPQPMATGSRFQAVQISQPQLERTTCTDATRDLPRTDKTLTRQVTSHKIIEVDPRNASKFL